MKHWDLPNTMMSPLEPGPPKNICPERAPPKMMRLRDTIVKDDGSEQKEKKANGSSIDYQYISL
jgi:hypothetical protein